MIFIVSFLSTYWVLKQLNLLSSSDEIFLESCIESTSQRPISLHDILSEEKQINMFMQHLMKEFSMECLLSFIEMNQYKARFMEVFQIELNDENRVVTDWIVLPDGVSKSDIVYNEHEEDNDSSQLQSFMDKAYMLYNK